jgi:methionyl-tRNA synthetase
MYVTTALPYVNAAPHLGHLYEVVVCDTLARYWRRREATFFLTGTDEHGDKIARAAAENGLAPRAFVDQIATTFRDTWDSCGISYDHFVRTTDPAHVRVVQEVLRRVHAKGDIYLARYGGMYCTGCERYYSERESANGQCPEHQRPLEYIEEDSYFFRMARYQEPWLRYLEARPETIVPEGYRKEVLSLLRHEVLGDLSISRPKSRLNWGIDLPFDERYVTYVWFDALFSYVSGLHACGEETFARFWPQAHHIVGKDIVKPHGIFWPTMLMAAELPLYQQLHVHGYWTRGESKMSKSLGNVIRPLDLRERFGMEAVRYFLLREMAYGHDAVFTEDALITRINADLANNLGNLVSRTLSMQQRYFGGEVQPLGACTAEDEALMAAFELAAQEVPRFTEELAFHRALEALWRAIDQANKYVVVTAPFKLAKDPAARPRLGSILHHLLEALRVTATLLAWAMPDTSARIAELLRIQIGPGLAEVAWGTHLPPHHTVAAPVALFPRIETSASA